MSRKLRADFRDPRKCAAQSAEGFVTPRKLAAQSAEGFVTPQKRAALAAEGFATPRKRAALAALPLRGLQEHTLMGRIAATSLLQGYPKLRFGFFGVALSSEYLQPGLVIEVHLHQVVGERYFSAFQGPVKQVAIAQLVESLPIVVGHLVQGHGLLVGGVKRAVEAQADFLLLLLSGRHLCLGASRAVLVLPER